MRGLLPGVRDGGARGLPPARVPPGRASRTEGAGADQEIQQDQGRSGYAGPHHLTQTLPHAATACGGESPLHLPPQLNVCLCVMVVQGVAEDEDMPVVWRRSKNYDSVREPTLVEVNPCNLGGHGCTILCCLLCTAVGGCDFSCAIS